MTSRSWQSRAKASRTTSPFQQVNSSASEHQRQFELIAATWPSCSRARRRALDPGGPGAMPSARRTSAVDMRAAIAALYAAKTSATAFFEILFRHTIADHSDLRE